MLCFQSNGDIHGTGSTDERSVLQIRAKSAAFGCRRFVASFIGSWRRGCKIKFITCVQDLVHHLHNPALDLCNEKEELI
jgi:hypothetical protein